MSLLSRTRWWLRALVEGPRLDADLGAELRLWIDELAARHEAAGMSPGEARRQAVLEVGGIEQVKEVVRDQRVGTVLRALASDIRYAFRQMRMQPAFTATVVLVLAIGTGASTAVFSVTDVLFLRPPPFAHVNRLVHVFDVNPQKAEPGVDIDPSPANFLDWRERMHSFDQMAAWRNWYYTLAGSGGAGDSPESVRGVRVSPIFFDMLGVNVIAGRTFQADEETVGRDGVVILAHRLWTRRFGADLNVIGRTVQIDGRPHVVVGVLPDTFQFLQPDLDVWMPLTIDDSLRNRANHSVIVVARLKTGVTLRQAQAEMDSITAGLAQEFPETNAGWGVRLEPLHPNHYLQHLRPGLSILLGASLLVLLIACANGAYLILSRTMARRREFAIRAALGASRVRLGFQALAESLVLGTIGAIAGCGVAFVAVRGLFPLLPHGSINTTVASYGPVGSMVIDARIFGLAAVLAIVTGGMCGVLPALHASKEDFLKLAVEKHRPALGSRILIMTEIALSVVLLFGATLLLESLWRLQQINPGFRPEQVLTLQVWLPKTEYRQPAAIADFFQAVLRRVDRLPGVRAAGAVNFRPFLGMGSRTTVDIQGWAPADPRDGPPLIPYRVVSPDYLNALGQPLLNGRDFADTDGVDSSGVALINQAMAKRFWPNQNPIGEHIRPTFHHTDIPWHLDAVPRVLTVIGVVGNIKEFRMTDADYPEFYVSYLQFPSSFMYLVVRGERSVESLAGPIRTTMQGVDPGQPVSLIQTMEFAVSRSIGEPRFNLALLGLFAAVAILLAAAGVYGLTAYSVRQRTKEIGIRMALGASASTVCRMFVRELLIVGGVGIVMGMIVAGGLSGVMANLVYGVSPIDPMIMAASAATLLTVAVVAAAVPAGRVAFLDPLITLRCD